MRKGRRDSSFDDNYYIFIRCLLKERVPSVLVITCCEMESPMSSWIDKAQNKRNQQKEQEEDNFYTPNIVLFVLLRSLLSCSLIC
ncbi:unnamed protein product [Rotaria socialis]